jgi:DNA-directed RNA polymerase subunit beta'
MSDRDGTVTFGADSKGKRKIVVVSDDGQSSDFTVPKGRHIIVTEGDYIRKGQTLVDGSPSPHDILRILGTLQLAKYLVDEIQDVYRLQGVKINDKHIEVIVRQMCRRVKVLSPGDTRFLPAEQVEKGELDDANAKVREQGGQEAIFEPVLLGITKASLSTDSFISAASFQETTKVLTEAAINSKVDHLRGLKENVIMGRLIPAGTGVPSYKTVDMYVEGQTHEAEAISEAATPQMLAGKISGGGHQAHRY